MSESNPWSAAEGSNPEVPTVDRTPQDEKPVTDVDAKVSGPGNSPTYVWKNGG